MIRNNKGVTLVAIVLTIVILLIISGIAINTGTKGAETAAENKLLSELKIVQHAVLERYTKAAIVKEDVPGSKLTTYQDIVNEIDSSIQLKITEVNYTNLNKYQYYYILYPQDLAKIGVANGKDTYIVNYSTGEVINKTTPRTAKGEVLYTYAVDGNT